MTCEAAPHGDESTTTISVLKKKIKKYRWKTNQLLLAWLISFLHLRSPPPPAPLRKPCHLSLCNHSSICKFPKPAVFVTFLLFDSLTMASRSQNDAANWNLQVYRSSNRVHVHVCVYSHQRLIFKPLSLLVWLNSLLPINLRWLNTRLFDVDAH